MTLVASHCLDLKFPT